MAMITVEYKGKSYNAGKYSSIGEFFQKNFPEEAQRALYMDNPIVAALANSEALPLSARFNHSFKLEEVRLFSDLGRKIYRSSICFLLAYATEVLFPERRLIIGHSLGDGYYFHFDDGFETTPGTVEAIGRKMRELCEAGLEIERRFLSYDDAMEYFTAHGNQDTVALLEYSNAPAVECYRVRDWYDICVQVLAPNTRILSLWELMPYGDGGMLLRYPRSAHITEIRPFVDNPLLFSVFNEYKRWGKILGIQSIGQLDKVCYDEGKIREYISLSEALQARKIASIADGIHERGARLVLVAGPSSSGKTTFACKLCLQLRMLGHRALRISLDNYYVSRERTPVAPDGSYDFEALEALDLDLFQSNIADLLAGRPVRLPRYCFSDLSRRYDEEPQVLGDDAVMVVEGLHGLNPKLLPGFDRSLVYKIFISALTQINLDDHTRLSTTDNRLLRRLVRDARFRSTPAIETLRMWPSVQKGAQRYIFPHQNNADIILNSALDYEVAVLARFAVPLLKMVKPSAESAYTTARRMLKILENVHPIQSSLVPQDSLLREFIGGSQYDV